MRSNIYRNLTEDVGDYIFSLGKTWLKWPKRERW